jgi:hypothetical protein
LRTQNILILSLSPSFFFPSMAELARQIKYQLLETVKAELGEKGCSCEVHDPDDFISVDKDGCPPQPRGGEEATVRWLLNFLRARKEEVVHWGIHVGVHAADTLPVQHTTLIVFAPRYAGGK